MKKQPQRTCIACRRSMPKRALLRLVHTPAGEITVDPKGKLAGRGAYLCAYQDCWLRALRSKLIGPALKTTLTEDVCARLEAYARGLPERSSEEQGEEPPVAAHDRA